MAIGRTALTSAFLLLGSAACADWVGWYTPNGVVRFYLGDKIVDNGDPTWFSVADTAVGVDKGATIERWIAPVPGLKPLRWGWTTSNGGLLSGLTWEDHPSTNYVWTGKKSDSTYYYMSVALAWTTNGVTFRRGAGEEGATAEVAEQCYTNRFALPACGFVRTGCSFDGWTNGLGRVYAAGQTVSGADFPEIRNSDATVFLQARWRANTNRVFVVTNAVAGADRTLIETNDVPFMLTAPVWTGHTFQGWRVSSGLDPKRAKYGQDDGEAVETSIPYATTLCKSNPDDPDGRVWFKNLNPAEGTNVTLAAVWTTNECTATFIVYGANNGYAEQAKVTYGEPLPQLANVPTYSDGYSFGGYFTEENGRGECYWDAKGKPAETESGARRWLLLESRKFYALKISWTYAIQFMENGGTPPAGGCPTLNYTNGLESALWSGAGLTRENCELLGWAQSDSATAPKFAPGAAVLGTESGLTLSDGATVKLYAVWRDLRQTTRFDPGDGTLGGSGDTSRALPGTPYGELPVATREGYVFAGWWTAATGGELVTANTVVPPLDDERTLHAHWSELPQIEDVAFEGNGKTAGEMSSQQFFRGVPQALATNQFAREGFAFAGWTNAAGRAFLDGEVVAFDGAATLYAKWTEVPVTVEFRANGGVATSGWGELAALTLAGDERKPLPDGQELSRGGLWAFDGWTNAAGRVFDGGEEVSRGQFGGGAPAVLYAKWKSKLTDLSIAADCDNLILISEQQDPLMAGSANQCWTVGVNASAHGGTVARSAENLKKGMSEMWTEPLGAGTMSFRRRTSIDNDCRVLKKMDQSWYVSDDSSLVLAEYLGDFDGEGSRVEFRTPGGYPVGWTTLSQFEIDQLVWWPDSVAVHLVAEGAEGFPKTLELETKAGAGTYGEKLVAPVREGWTFRGWHVLEDGRGAEVAAASPVPNQFTVLYAAWENAGEPARTEVVFDAGSGTSPGGESPFAVSFPQGGAFGELWPEAPASNGCTFAGWWTKPSGGEQVTFASPVPAESTTYYAHWSQTVAPSAPDEVLVAFRMNDGSGLDWTAVACVAGEPYGGNWPALTPSRDGYDFYGWFADPAGGTEVSPADAATAARTELFAFWLPACGLEIDGVSGARKALVATRLQGRADLEGVERVVVTGDGLEDLPLLDALGISPAEGLAPPELTLTYAAAALEIADAALIDGGLKVTVRIVPGAGNALVRTDGVAAALHVFGTDDLAQPMRYLGALELDLGRYLDEQTKGELDVVVPADRAAFVKVRAETTVRESGDECDD